MPLLEIQMIQFTDVAKVYPNGTVGLKDVNLRIDDGEFIAIIGRSGAGKSTLLRSINRMHPITSGNLNIDDVDVEKLSSRELRRLRRRIGMIFQSFNLVTRTTVIRNVLTAFVPDMPLARRVLGIFRRQDKLKALECLDKVGTLAQNPSIILADEPVAALDPVTARVVMDDFKKINREMGITVIINIHHVELALEYCDRVIGIKEGMVVFDGPSSHVDQKVLSLVYGEIDEKE